MIPNTQSLPLKIIHNFPYPANTSLDEKKSVVTSDLLDIASRGFGGIVNNVCTRNYTLDPTEWEVFAFVADECERLGLRLWIYDEDGYPSGAAGNKVLKDHPEDQVKGLVCVTGITEGGVGQ